MIRLIQGRRQDFHRGVSNWARAKFFESRPFIWPRLLINVLATIYRQVVGLKNHPNAAVLWFLNTENDKVRPHLFLFIVISISIGFIGRGGGVLGNSEPPCLRPCWCKISFVTRGNGPYAEKWFWITHTTSGGTVIARAAHGNLQEMYSFQWSIADKWHKQKALFDIHQKELLEKKQTSLTW